jgi:hypothetical protein
MTGELSRRLVLRGISHAAAFGALASALPGIAAAADGEAAYSLSMTYQYDRKNKFKADRFRDAHLPLLRSIYGDSIERVELRYAEPPQSTAKAPIPPWFVVAAVSIWIRDVVTFGKRTAEAGSQIVADLQKVTEGHPVVQYDKTLAGLGSSRADVVVGSTCQSLYFLDKEGAHFDAKYYVDTFIPKLMEAYGPKAVRRLEVCQGAAGQGGAKPLAMSATHLYVADQTAFFAASRNALDLAPERTKFTDILPITAFSTVHAVG